MKRPFLVAVSAVVVLLVVVVVSRSVGSRMATAIEPLLDGGDLRLEEIPSGKVLHIRASAESMGAPGTSTRKQHELWLDPKADDARYTVMKEDGSDKVTTTRSGRTISRYHHDQARKTTDVAASDDAAFLEVGAPLLMAHRLVASGSADGNGRVTVTHGELNGQEVIHVQMPAPDGIDAQVVYTVAKDTLLPLRIEVVRATADGDVSTLEGQTWSYEAVEILDRSQLPADLFSALSDDPAVTEARSTYMTLDQARGFAEFATFFVGESYNGLPISGITHSQGLGPGYARKSGGPPMVRFSITYADSFKTTNRRVDRLSIVQMPGDCPKRGLIGVHESTPGEGSAAPPSETVTVGADQGLLFPRGSGDRADLQLQRSGTCILVYGQDREDVLRAGELLRPLNRLAMEDEAGG